MRDRERGLIMATTVAAPSGPGDVGLKRDIGLIGAMWASEGSIIGSGWLFGSLYAVQAAGPAAVLSWAFASIAVIVLALVHSELGGMYPVAGGTARFPHYAYGSVAGISFGFFSWLQAVSVAPIECYAVMQYGSHFWHSIYNTDTQKITGLGFVMTIILMAVFTAVNFLAIRWLAHTNSAVTWWKVAIPLLTIIFLAFKFHGGNFSTGGGFMPGGFNAGMKGVFSAITSAGVMFALLGFEQADQLAGEVRNPQKNVPRAIIGAVLIGSAIYLLLQVVFIGALPHDQIASGFAKISNPNILRGPFAGLAGLVGFGWLASILYADAFISPAGTGLIYVTSTSRVGYGLGRNHYYPQVFTKTDRRGVPWVGLITAGALGLLFLLPFPSWHSLVGLVTSASVLMYAGAPLSLGAFRKQVPDANRPYRLGGASVLSPVAFAIAGLIIYWSGFETIWKLGIALVIGYVLIGISMIFDKDRPPLDWKSATWLPVYLIGMGLISWQGQYGPGNTGRIHLWYDMLIVAAFSVAIYFWAIATRLPRDEMLKVVGQQALPDATPGSSPTG
jgi:amino acid transporter